MTFNEALRVEERNLVMVRGSRGFFSDNKTYIGPTGRIAINPIYKPDGLIKENNTNQEWFKILSNSGSGIQMTLF